MSSWRSIVVATVLLFTVARAEDFEGKVIDVPNHETLVIETAGGVRKRVKFWAIRIKGTSRTYLELVFLTSGRFVRAKMRGEAAWIMMPMPLYVNGKRRKIDLDINHQMVLRGMAVCLPNAPSHLRQAEEHARQQRIGIWAEAPIEGGDREKALKGKGVDPGQTQ